MTSTDGDADTPPEPATIDKATVMAWIRQVLDEDAPDAATVGDDTEPDVPDKARFTVAEAEQIAEQAVRKAMKTLAAAKPKTPPRPKDDSDGKGGAGGEGTGAAPKDEAPPAPPPPTPSSFQARLRKFLVGVD
jgi:hypothetical protein